MILDCTKTLQCIVLQQSSLCTQLCAWSSWSVVRVSFWEWSSHLDWLHSLPLYPTNAQLHYSTTAPLHCTSPLCYSTKQAPPVGQCCQNTLVASPGGQIYATEKEWVVPAMLAHLLANLPTEFVRPNGAKTWRHFFWAEKSWWPNLWLKLDIWRSRLVWPKERLGQGGCICVFVYLHICVFV